MRRLWNEAIGAVLRPYIWRELPGWGRLYEAAIGGYRHNARWTGYAPRWVRGKVHGHAMRLDLNSWSNREAYFVGRYFDAPTQLVIKAVLASGDTFVDIGANEGMIALTAASVVGAAGRVIAFEPNPGPRAIFAETVARNGLGQVDIRAMGLSDTAGELPLSVPAINSGEGSFGRPSYATTDMAIVQCPVRVGDDELAGETPRLVKIDVEGFELHVLRGLARTIERARPVVILEMVAHHLVNAGTTPRAIADLLAEAGYRGWKLGQSGRGATLRATLEPPVLTDDLWDDFLWVHAGDPLAGDIAQRLARTALAG